MAIKKTDDIEELFEPIQDIMDETNQKALSIITKRIKEIGEMSKSDVQRLSVLIRNGDLKEIESIIADGINKSIEQVDEMLVSVATYNDEIAIELFKAKNTTPTNFNSNKSLYALLERAKKSMEDGLANISDTTALNLVVNNKPVPIKQAYTHAVNRAIYEVQQGIFDYNTAMRGVLLEMAKNGIGIIEYESGHRRRLDSAVRMNVLDGVRSVNMEYRKIQGEQYGANRVFITFHMIPGPDHAYINGRDFSVNQWEKINNSLDRKLGTLNCRHGISYGISGVSKNPITEAQRQAAMKNANRKVEYTTLQKDSSGEFIKKEVSLYESSQVQRKIETDIRRLRDQKAQLDELGDKVGAAVLKKRISNKTKYYKSVSDEIGLSAKIDRTKVVK